MKSANDCGGVSFCCKAPGFAAVDFDENLLEMKWLRETKRAELFCSTDGHTQDHGLCSCGLRGTQPAGNEREEEWGSTLRAHGLYRGWEAYLLSW